MIEVTSYDAWQQLAAAEEAVLLFAKTDGCSVCDGLYPQVAELEARYPFPFVRANVSDIPEIAGQLSLFAAPAVLLFRHGDEWQRFVRFVRFVPMADLTQRLDELKEAVDR